MPAHRDSAKLRFRPGHSGLSHATTSALCFKDEVPGYATAEARRAGDGLVRRPSALIAPNGGSHGVFLRRLGSRLLPRQRVRTPLAKAHGTRSSTTIRNTNSTCSRNATACSACSRNATAGARPAGDDSVQRLEQLRMPTALPTKGML